MDKAIIEGLGIPGLKSKGAGGGGCINESIVYLTPDGRKIHVKVNKKSEARRMFDGELASLNTLFETETVKVPKPIKVLDLPGGGAALAMEHLDIKSLRKYSALLGEQLARLHLHNSEQMSKAAREEGFVGKGENHDYVDKFGFHAVTCCGYLPQDNTWDSSWTKFYANKLNYQLTAVEKEYGDRDARELWSKLQIKLPEMFKDMDIKPALMHGDLWGDNAGEVESAPVIFDPASFYGHSEYDLAISNMFGGFGQSFFNGYFKVLPKQDGYSQRSELYQLFHYLNHWNHFGGGYRGSSIAIMKQLVSS